ncbi:alginate O-acetyltransferase complex protein AlgI [Labrenzia sp. EL_126]|nr:alginate O-acetyltransferase complex protein AlgI [Labrenzia sp. EL_126]
MIHSLPWWMFLSLAPVCYWILIPAPARAWALGLGSLTLLAFYLGTDLVMMCAVAAYAFAEPRLERWGAADWLVRAGRIFWPFWVVLIYFVWSKYLPTIGNVFAMQANFFDIAVPVGISYFSFKLLHYSIEMRRVNIPDHRPEDFVSWLFCAPIFTAGPIERFEHYLSHRRQNSFEARFVWEGSLRIAQGLVKKFFFGVMVLELIQRASGFESLVAMLPYLNEVSPWVIWAALFLTLLYVYLDFSAYSDIAIGSSRLFGLTIMENFNMPFVARNLQEFWQRWHMTLAHWCRSYIYMSMIGLTRNPYWAIIATFFVMGLWHAASLHWIIWGLWHGLGMAAIAWWGRFSTKHKIKVFKGLVGQWTARVMTLGYVALGGAFTALHNQATSWDSLRLIAGAFGINL